MRTVFSALTIIMVILGVACSDKKARESQTAEDDSVWPEMDEFHMIMAESFHPFKDSANLDPAKANAAEMAKIAAKWADAPLPEKVNSEEVKSSLAQLKVDSETFAQLVQSGDSTKIVQALTSLHDRFHALQEAWYGGEGKEDHEHH